jgi:hypothetical protein
VCLWIARLAGMRGSAQWRGACLWIAGLTGLKGTIQRRLCGSEGLVFGGAPVGLWSAALVGLRSGPEDWRSHGPWSRGSGGLRDGAWHAALAVLLVNHGVEKPSTS